MTGPGNMDFDVLIAGAGMVGCTAACLFAEQDLRVGLVDSRPIADWDENTTSPRVSALNIASANLFRYLRVWPGIERRRFSRYVSMRVWEENTEASISFDARELGYRELGYIIENNAVISALAEKLRQNYNVSILEGATITGRQPGRDRVELEMDSHQVLTCKLLVGADGAKSRVREISAIDCRYFDYRQDAIVTTVAPGESHRGTAWQCFLPTGPVAMLPLSDGRCAVVWSCDRGLSEELMSRSDLDFESKLSGHFRQHLGEISLCSQRFLFPLGQHHAAQYISTRTALVGDAAHITHPLAGLGANIGLLDTAALAQVVGNAHRAGKRIAGQPVLRRYERWRKGENSLVLSTMKGFKTLFGSSAKPLVTARRLGLNAADDNPPLKQMFARYAMGIAGDIPEACRK